jgi:hypothetical protein
VDILLLNQNWFANELQALGHRTVSFGRGEWVQIRQDKILVSWPELLNSLPKGFNPELLIVYDDSSPILVTELETLSIPSFFYSVDTHHHLHFHRYLGHVFTHVFIAQKDYIQGFLDVGVKPYWLPLWASQYLEPSAEKKYGAVFLGTLNAELNPERVKFFEELQKLVKVDVRTAPFAEVFPHSSIIINQTVKGDLNFRVFEAMMSGALLITERSGNGLNELFSDGEDLVLYSKGDYKEAAACISHYLDHPDQAQAIGARGREKICSSHLARHRANFMLSQLNSPTRPNDRIKKVALIRNFTSLAAGLQKQGETLWATRSFLEVIRLAQLGMQDREQLDACIAFDIMYAFVSLQSYLSPAVLENFLDDLRNVYPDALLFTLVKIHFLNSTGRKEQSKAIALSLNADSSDEIICKASQIVEELRMPLIATKPLSATKP